MNALIPLFAKRALFPTLALALLCSCGTPSTGTRAQGATKPPPRRPFSRSAIEKPHISEAQKQVIRQAKTAYIAVEQTFKNDAGDALSYSPALPFAERTISVLALGGITNASSPETADITVSIKVEGHELSGSYSYGGFGVGQKRVAGSSLSGEVAIKSGDMTPIRRPIHGGTGLPYSIPSFGGPGPQFQQSFDQCNFTEILLGVLAQTHGAEALAKGATDSSTRVRTLCAKALGDLATPTTTEPLTKLLQDSDEGVRFAAADALAASPDPNATSLLKGALEQGSSKTKCRVAQCLGSRRDAQAVDALLTQLKGNDSAVSGACASALGNIGDPRAIDPLIEAMENPKVRFQARQALKKITGKDLGDEPMEWKQSRQK
jgi:hypothetical protein